jgi:pimeloyl-ACP methyl ester carboxylesterase
MVSNAERDEGRAAQAGRAEVDTRAGRVAVSWSGAGPPLLLLPAAGRAAADFDAVSEPLAARHRVIAVDWPGMGESPAPERPEQLSAPLLADALEDVIAALAPGPVAIVGHSVGGFAGARLAARAPDSVRALVLVDAGGFADIGLFARLFCAVKGRVWITRAVEARFARFHTHRRTEAAERMIARVEVARRRPGYAEVVAALWRSFARPGARLDGPGGEAAAIRCETLLVWGARDPVIPLRAGRAAARAIAGARLVALETGHSPFAEDPDGFLAAVEPFLAAALAGGAAA